MTVSLTMVPIFAHDVAVMQKLAKALLSQMPDLNPCGCSATSSSFVSLSEPDSLRQTQFSPQSTAVLMFICTDPPGPGDSRPDSDSDSNLLGLARTFRVLSELKNVRSGLKIVGISSNPETRNQLLEAGCVFVGTLPTVLEQIPHQLQSWLPSPQVP